MSTDYCTKKAKAAFLTPTGEKVNQSPCVLSRKAPNIRAPPPRKLEGFIFDCVLYMDELKEQLQEQPLTRDPSPSPARSPSPSEGRENLNHMQVPRIFFFLLLAFGL